MSQSKFRLRDRLSIFAVSKNKMRYCRWFLIVLIGCYAVMSNNCRAQVYYAGTQPGKATMELDKQKDEFVLSNNVLSVRFKFSMGQLTDIVFSDKMTHKVVYWKPKDLFEITLADATKLDERNFKMKGQPVMDSVLGNRNAQMCAERKDGVRLSAIFMDPANKLTILWQFELRDDCNYLKQEIQLSGSRPVEVKKIVAWSHAGSASEPDIDKGEVQVMGQVEGSPVVDQNMFFVLQSPLSSQEMDTLTGRIRSALVVHHLLNKDTLQVSSAWGVTPVGQLRRGFLYYVEMERHHPYRQFLHYNSWFDLSFADRKLDEKSCLDRIQCFADSLILKRHTAMDGFLFDDGWDDNHSLWSFNKAFPSGFTNLKQLAGKYRARLGVWISPWGGYDQAKEERLKYGRLQQPPFEINDNGFSLAGPNYYQRFLQVAMKFIKQYGVGIFKFDGIGSQIGANGVTTGANEGDGNFQKDFAALLKLINALREAEPDLYLSLTIGTWPSAAWLKYADVIWRSGADNGQTGEGSERQRWLNFRDGAVYNNIVSRAPLFPLNAVMNHGICIAEHGLPAKYEKDDKSIAAEIWSFFGTGTSLQELYVNPHLLTTADWDCLAKAINWSRKHQAVLPDIHWVGGNPNNGDVYGYAAWKHGGGVLTLRNPTNHRQILRMDINKIFDLPASEVSASGDSAFHFYQVNLPGIDRKWITDGKREGSHQLVTFNLDPFEVLVMDAVEKGG